MAVAAISPLRTETMLQGQLCFSLPARLCLWVADTGTGAPPRNGVLAAKTLLFLARRSHPQHNTAVAAISSSSSHLRLSPAARNDFSSLFLLLFVCLQRTKRVDRIDGKFGGPKKRIDRDWSTAPESRIKSVRKRRAVPPAKQVTKELCEFLCELLCSSARLDIPCVFLLASAVGT